MSDTAYHDKPLVTERKWENEMKRFDEEFVPVTGQELRQIISDTDRDGKFKFVVGEGVSKKGPIPPTGNTNTRGFFAPTTREFVKKWVMEGPTHHYALGGGKHAEAIRKIASVLGIECVVVK